MWFKKIIEIFHMSKNIFVYMHKIFRIYTYKKYIYDA